VTTRPIHELVMIFLVVEQVFEDLFEERLDDEDVDDQSSDESNLQGEVKLSMGSMHLELTGMEIGSTL
jgi:hypothetical protein